MALSILDLLLWVKEKLAAEKMSTWVRLYVLLIKLNQSLLLINKLLSGDKESATAEQYLAFSVLDSVIVQ